MLFKYLVYHRTRSTWRLVNRGVRGLGSPNQNKRRRFLEEYVSKYISRTEESGDSKS